MPLHLLRAAKKDSTTAATSLFCCCHCLHHPFLRPAGIVILLSSVGLGTITQTFSETMAGPNDAASPSTSSSSGSGSSFPAKEVLLTAGTGFFLGMFYFYKRKQTLPFKVCYGLMWPTLGGGIMLAVTPTPEEMAQRLEQSRAVTSEDLRKQRVANAATVEAMAKQYAGQQR